jgi:hypothetical protein
MSDEYNFVISSSFPNGIEPYQLKEEFLTSNISSPCMFISTAHGNADIFFQDILSNADVEILGNVISHHVPLPQPIAAPAYVIPGTTVISHLIEGIEYKYLGNQTNEVHISKQTQGYYSSVKAALDAYSGQQNIVFLLHPGTYVEQNPLYIPPGCVLQAEGTAENTFVVAQDPTKDLIHLGPKAKLEAITFVGAAYPGCRGVYFDASQSGQGILSAIFECFFIDCNIAIESDGKNSVSPIDTLFLRECLVVPNSVSIDTGVYCHGKAQVVSVSLNISAIPGYFGILNGVMSVDTGSKLSMTTSSIWYCDTAMYINNGGELESNLCTCNSNDTSVYIGADGVNTKLNGSLLNVQNSQTFDMDIQATDPDIDVQSGNFNPLKINNPNDITINAQFQSFQFGTFYRNILGNVVFGTKRFPSKIAIGEGTYDIDGVVAFTNSNLESGTWTDVTLSSISDGQPPYNFFQGTAPGNCFYIGRDDNTLGVKVQVLTPAVGANFTDIVWEYWDGTNWIEFDTFQSSATPPYYTVRGSFIGTADKYQIRFGLTSNSPLATKLLNTANKKWVRARIVNTLPSIPVAGYCKLHVNATEVDSDGFIEYYGNARQVDTLQDWNVVLMRDVNSSSTNNDIYLYDKLSLSGKLFHKTTVDRIGISDYLPFEADLGFPFKIKFSCLGDNAISGNVHFSALWGCSMDNSNVFTTSISATTYTPTSHNYSNTTVQLLGSGIEARGELELDFCSVISNPSDGKPDLVWVTIQRDSDSGNDTYNGNVILMQTNVIYVKWCSGGHLLSY